MKGDNTSNGNSLQLLPHFFVSSFELSSIRSTWQLCPGWKIHSGCSEELQEVARQGHGARHIYGMPRWEVGSLLFLLEKTSFCWRARCGDLVKQLMTSWYGMIHSWAWRLEHWGSEWAESICTYIYVGMMCGKISWRFTTGKTKGSLFYKVWKPQFYT